MIHLLKNSIVIYLLFSSTLLSAQDYTITTLGGNGTEGFKVKTRTLSSSKFSEIGGLAIDDSGYLYACDISNNLVYKIDCLHNNIEIFAGNGEGAGFEVREPLYGGEGDKATLAELFDPDGVAVDKYGNVFISSEHLSSIKEVYASNGIIKTIGGNPNPRGIAVDDSGNVFYSSTVANKIYKIDGHTHVLTIVAGTGSAGFGGDNDVAIKATFSGPEGVAVDDSGNIYIADTKNNRIRKINSKTKKIITIAGNGYGAAVDYITGGYKGDGGKADSAELYGPSGIAVDKEHNVYFTDCYNNVVRMVDAKTGIITTIAGDGQEGSSNRHESSNEKVDALKVSLYHPRAIVLDKENNIYIVDKGFLIRRIWYKKGGQ